jgi:NADPH:quinone reductase-like Zn-dependent oxidoreductase
MKAWGFRRYGGGETLELLDVPTPSVRGGDLLIQVQAAGVNPVDYKLRNGEFRFILKSQMPFVLGHEGAGIVVDKGRGVTDFACGDEVYFARPHSHPSGSWAEYAVVSEKLASRRPQTISVEEVAGIPVAGITCWQAFHTAYSLGIGDRVFIPAGSGGVGSLGIQLAKLLGAYVVSSTSRKNLEFVKGLGADEVVDYQLKDFSPEKKMDMVFDTLGQGFHRQAFRLLRRGGTLLSIVGPPTQAAARRFELGPHLIFGCLMLSAWTHLQAQVRHTRYRFLAAEPNREQLEALARFLDNRLIRPVVDRVYSFDETPAALAYVESRHARGKVIVRVS